MIIKRNLPKLEAAREILEQLQQNNNQSRSTAGIFTAQILEILIEQVQEIANESIKL